MKRILIATTLAIVLMGGQVFAETDPAQVIDEQWAANAEAQQTMHRNMAKMRATMEKIHSADDPAVRKQLMHEHMQEMRTMMDMMGAKSGTGMTGGQMMGGHAQGEGMKHDGAMPMCKDDTAQCRQMNSMAKRQEHMAQKMAMMQMMMQQMMEHGAAHEGKESHEHQ